MFSSEDIAFYSALFQAISLVNIELVSIAIVLAAFDPGNAVFNFAALTIIA
jgi:DNA repair protein RadC